MSLYILIPAELRVGLPAFGVALDVQDDDTIGSNMCASLFQPERLTGLRMSEREPKKMSDPLDGRGGKGRRGAAAARCPLCMQSYFSYNNEPVHLPR